MTRVGLAIAVQDADPFVKQHSHWQTLSGGGRGAAREVCELLLEAHGLLTALREPLSAMKARMTGGSVTGRGLFYLGGLALLAGLSYALLWLGGIVAHPGTRRESGPGPDH
jgi:hypothetical protein